MGDGRVIGSVLAVVFFVGVLASPAAARAQAPAVELDGRSLTIDDVVRVATRNAGVVIAPSALARVQRSFDLLLAAADVDIPIYGLNHGVGQNKDRTVFRGRLDAEARRLSEEFNQRNLRATSAGAGPTAPVSRVRAAMLIRLNTMLFGQTGARPRVAELYREFLNHGIHPLLPTRASVGEADITILAHVGLAMMGEGTVEYRGRHVPAAEALRAAGLPPLVPFGKDSLAIMSSNAYAAAVAVLAVHEADRVLEASLKVFALSLEALNGNVSPFLEPVYAIRPYGPQGDAAATIRSELHGSYLWSRSAQRALQDPLSFRTASHVIGGARQHLAALKALLLVQMNSSDDNPAVIPDIAPPGGASEQVLSYYVRTGPVRGAVIPNANFEPLPWVLPLQSLNVALSHVSRSAAARITRLGAPEFTRLSRFLAPDDTTLAYSAIQKVYAALDAEIQALSVPVSKDSLPLAGDIEDTATNSVDAAARLRRIVEDLYYVVGIELMHAAQAIDLRRRGDPALQLGRGTGALYAAFRRVVPFLDRDRPLTPDIAASARFLGLSP
jgi:histidine ammonia-lyase